MCSDHRDFVAATGDHNDVLDVLVPHADLPSIHSLGLDSLVPDDGSRGSGCFGAWSPESTAATAIDSSDLCGMIAVGAGAGVDVEPFPIDLGILAPIQDPGAPPGSPPDFHQVPASPAAVDLVDVDMAGFGFSAVDPVPTAVELAKELELAAEVSGWGRPLMEPWALLASSEHCVPSAP